MPEEGVKQAQKKKSPNLLTSSDEPPEKSTKKTALSENQDDDDDLASIIFFCEKCQQTLSLEDVFKVEKCGHKICRKCTRQFLLDWQILRCPLFNSDKKSSCPAEMSLEDAGLVLESEEFAAFQRQIEVQIGNNQVVGEGKFLCDICTAASSLEEMSQIGLDCDHILCKLCASNYVNDLNCPVFGCKAKLDPKSSVPNDNRKTFECQICAESIRNSDLFRFEQTCGHEICRDCARHYLKTLIDERKPLKCPICEADFEFSDAELVLDENDYERLFDMLLQIGVADCVHCPKADCPGVAEVVPPRYHFACPECKYEMCVRCRNDWHGGSVTCEEYEKWLQENGKVDEKFNEYAKLKRIQICPKCHQGVEKNKGCNHMHCRCGADFCYRCGQLYGGSLVKHKCKKMFWQGDQN